MPANNITKTQMFLKLNCSFIILENNRKKAKLINVGESVWIPYLTPNCWLTAEYAGGVNPVITATSTITLKHTPIKVKTL